MSQNDKDFFIELKTPLNDFETWVISFKGNEGCSQLFNYRLVIALKEPLTNVNTYLGKPINIVMKGSNANEVRNFNGLLISLTANYGHHFPTWYCYEAEILPWLWLLSQRKNCRIFPGGSARKEVSVVEVLQELFDDYANFSVNLDGIKGNYPPRDFWLQYNETDLEFFTRLLAQHGIFYYFKHEQDQHILILADNKAAYSKNIIKPNNFGQEGGTEKQIKYFKSKYQIVPNTINTASHNYLQPTIKLHAKANSAIAFKYQQKLEPFIYLNNFKESDQGNVLAKMAMAREEAQYNSIELGSNLWMVNVAEILELDKRLIFDSNDHNFVITEICFEANNPSIPNIDSGAFEYKNTIICIPATQVYYSLMVNQPKSYQLHEAIVVGPDNEQIYTDDLGRIRVKFFWDHLGAEDINASCWIRVISAWEGTLRVGTPVLVGFIDGNIDQPIVLGPLYDAEQKPPFKENTMSGLKRRHGKNGDDSSYNELCFNDKKDAAHVLLHASKDMELAIDHDLATTIKNNELHKVTGARSIQVLEGDATWVVDKGNVVIKANEGKYELNIQGDVIINSASNIKIHAARELNLSAGMSVAISAKSINVNADAELELKGGVTTSIKGTMVEIN